MAKRDIRPLFATGAVAVICWAFRRGALQNPLLEGKPSIVAAFALANEMARGIWATLEHSEVYRDPVKPALPDPAVERETKHERGVVSKAWSERQMIDMIRVGQTRNLLGASSALSEIWSRPAHQHSAQWGQAAARTCLTKVSTRSHFQKFLVDRAASKKMVWLLRPTFDRETIPWLMSHNRASCMKS